MWRSKLFADMHIQLSEAMGHILEDDEDALSDTPTISEDRLFPAHRAILAARSPYFNSMFLSPFSDSESSLFTLPSPPFTPAALHFVLAYLYTGSFSLNRTFDLTVAMDIWKCATYLNNDILQEEVQCRIVDMCHGFRACCKTCRSRAVRTYAFAIAPEVNAKYLQAQAKSIVLDHFGELWGREVGNLPYTTQKDLLVDKCSRTNASNAADAMRGIMRIRSRLAGERNASWADHIRSMLVPLEDRIKHFLKADFAEMAVSRPFIDLVEGIGFSNDVLEKLLALLVESLSEKNAAGIYEVLVGKLLLREEGIAMDTRARLEDARQDILKYIKARWVGVKGLNSFEPLENWCLKELSDGKSIRLELVVDVNCLSRVYYTELEQTVDDLLQSPSLTAPLTTRTGLKLSTTKVHKVDSDAFSIVSAPPSLHASVLNRDTVRKSMTPSSSRKSTFTFNSGDAKSLSDNPRTPVRGVPGTKKRIVPKNRVDTQATEVVHAGDRIAGSLSALKVEHSVTSNPEPSGEGSQSARAPPVTSQSARQPPGMTKAARLRQSSTASKLLAQDTEAREKLARPSSSTSLRSHAGQSKLLNDSPRGGTASRAASIASTRTRRLDVDAASLRQKGVRTPTSPKPQGVRSSSVTSTLVKRRPSVSSIKSNRTTASSKYTASKSPKSQQSAIPPLPGSSESSVHLQTASTGVAFADLGRSPPGVKLQIGIDCVVTLGSIKFKATVRYLGGVYFDDETYVGVEVPAATSDVPEGLRWTDGTVDGVQVSTYAHMQVSKRLLIPIVQYFALSTRNKIEAPKGRSAVHSDRSKTKVKASPVGATRGLFVKPSQGMSTSEVW